jgi:osmoprotectant transport system substrate-binding protein
VFDFHAVVPGRRARLAVAVLAVVSLTGACGLVGGDDDSSAGDSATNTLTVGSANFTESIVLGEIYAQLLESKGITVSRKLNIGAREVYLTAIEDGSVDLLPEYIGSLLAYYSPDAGATAEDEVYSDLKTALPDGLEVLDKSKAADNDVLVVTKETAAKYDLHSLSDLAGISDDLTVGAAPEFRARTTGLVGLKTLYGVDLNFKPLDAGGPLTLKAIKNGDIQIGEFFSTQPVVKDEGFVILDDPKHLSPAENVVPLIRTDAVTPEITDALDKLSATLTSDDLVKLITKIDVDKQSVADVAKQFLTDKGLI